MKNIIVKFVISAVLAASPIISYAQSNTTPAPSVQDLQAIIRQLQEQMKALQSQVSGLKTEIAEVRIELKLTRSLQRGAKGDDVEQLQNFLKRFPDVYPEGLVTGFYGQKTEEAVRKYQQKQGLEPIGVVGPKTREKLQFEAERLNKDIVETPSGTIPAKPAIPTQPTEILQPPTVSSDLWAGEQVKCVFKGSTSAQKCYSYAKYGGTFTCEGVDACVTDVKGYLGEQLTWKSSCGGYAYTKIDGSNDYAEFNCASNQEQAPTPPLPVSPPTAPIIYEQVKCVFNGSTATQECYSAASYGGVFSCKGTDVCIADAKGYKGEKLTWKSSCGGYAYTVMDGSNDYAEFNCGSASGGGGSGSGISALTPPPPPPLPPPPPSSLPCVTSNSGPSGYITYDTCLDQEPVVIRRANGDLVAVFNSGGNGLAVLRSSVSQNSGQTWSEPKVAYESWDDIGLTESPGEHGNQQLVLLLKADSTYGGLITLTSQDGVTWANPRKVTPTGINNEAGSIMYSFKDGNYYVTYSNAVDTNADVFVARSNDLVNWDKISQVSFGGKNDFDSSIVQTSDGMFYIAYTSYTDNSTVVASSIDGKTWINAAKFTGYTSAHNGVNLVEIKGLPVLFVAQNAETYYSYPSGSAWVSLKKILSNTPFGVDAAVLPGDSVGLVWAAIAGWPADSSGQRDIRYTNVGMLPGIALINSRSNLATALESLTALLNSIGQLLEQIR